MFKIDWPCAIGGTILGYYAKGKVESAKTQFHGIFTGAVETMKEAFSAEDSSRDQNTKTTTTGGKNGH